MSEMAVEKFDQVPLFDHFIGFLDLDTHPKWKEIWDSQDEERFKKVLHYFGADVSKGFIFEQCIYRARRSDLIPNKQVEFGMIVRFCERQDDWWRSNMMSIEDVVRHTQNSLRSTGMVMGLNAETPLNDAMMEQATRQLTIADIKVDLGEGTVRKSFKKYAKRTPKKSISNKDGK